MPENRGGCGCGLFGGDCDWIIIVILLLCCCGGFGRRDCC